MPRRAAEPKNELDNLLDGTDKAGDIPAPKPDESPKPEPVVDPKKDEEPQKSPEQLEIERLRAELDAEKNKQATNPTTDSGKPLPDNALTPEQKEIRALQDQLAKTRTKSFLSSGDDFDEDGGERVIHFVADGFTGQGRVWYTGQTVSFGTASYEQTKDKFGVSWVDMDERAQFKRYGKVYFRPGAWEGATYGDEVAAEDARRGTAAPVIRF